jgi:tetratricopeptide (TPR) repeat protein
MVSKTNSLRLTGYLLVLVALACAAACAPHDSEPDETPGGGTTPAAADLIAQADSDYTQRDDLLRLRQGIVLLRQVRTVEPSNYEASWRLAKFSYYLATHTTGSEQEKALRDGIDGGKAAVKSQPEKPDGHFWLGANYGGALEAGLLQLATTGDVRSEMNTVLKLDEGYQNGSAYMVLGMVDLKAPRLVGGDPQQAVEEMQKGLRFGSDNAFLRLHLAEAYLAVGRKDDARQQLTAILKMTPDQNYLPEYKEAENEAHQQLAQLT